MALKDKNEHTYISFWWCSSSEDLMRTLKVDPNYGLSLNALEQNRLTFGSNTLEEIKPSNVMRLIFESIKEPMIILLLSIALLSGLFGKTIGRDIEIFVSTLDRKDF
jgi:P-type Ca2+ transporter type 2C